jgi:predicted DNA-binding WGR domain protein
VRAIVPGSSKFWIGDVRGKTLTVTFGRIGTDGQQKPKSFATPEAARAAYRKLVKEKLGKGYRRADDGGLDWEVSEAVEQFVSWLETAARKKQGLVFFCY